MYLLGYDIGSSSVKASLVNAETGKCVSSAFFPKTEAAIMAARPGWAEQDPQNWWENLKLSTQAVMAGSGIGPDGIAAIGISYQMHGLVCVDKGQNVLRPAIIWCDSRAVPYGQKAFEALGETQCLSHLLNSPGNFTFNMDVLFSRTCYESVSAVAGYSCLIVVRMDSFSHDFHLSI